MELQEYISILENYPREKRLKVGLGHPHSWRGYYPDLSFEPVEDVTIGEMIDCAKACIGKSFLAWKGGRYIMNETTEIHVEKEDGHYSNNSTLFEWFFELLLNQDSD